MSDIKVTYFNIKGLAETIRILLKYGGINFEDIRVERQDWPELKPSAPFGQMPLYEENGKTMWQSIAIARYVAKKVKLIGDSDWENLKIDAIVDTITDWRLKLVPLFGDIDAEKKETLKKTILSETVPFYLDRFEKFVAENDGYLATNKLTWADIYFSTIVDLFNYLLGENVLEKYNNLSSLRNKIREIPAIKEWIQNRPNTQY